MASSMDELPAHLLPLAMEEFPLSLALARVCRGLQREPRPLHWEPRPLCTQPSLYSGTIEEEEEGGSSLEEDQAQRTFLKAVESLRRSAVTGRPSFNNFHD